MLIAHKLFFVSDLRRGLQKLKLLLLLWLYLWIQIHIDVRNVFDALLKLSSAHKIFWIILRQWRKKSHSYIYIHIYPYGLQHNGNWRHIKFYWPTSYPFEHPILLPLLLEYYTLNVECIRSVYQLSNRDFLQTFRLNGLRRKWPKRKSFYKCFDCIKYIVVKEQNENKITSGKWDAKEVIKMRMNYCRSHDLHDWLHHQHNSHETIAKE